MRTILLLLLVGAAYNVLAQMPATVPVVVGKKISGISIFGIGYDLTGAASPRQLLTKCKFDENGNCVNREYYYPRVYPPANPDVPKASEYLHRSMQKQAFVKTLQTYSDKGRLIKAVNEDSDGNKTVSNYTFNDKGQEIKNVYKTNWFTNTTHKKYDTTGNLVSVRIYENDTLLINKDSVVYNSKNQKVLDYRWDSYHEDFIYYTYNNIDSIASQYWVVTQADNPSKKDTSNIILYEYDGKHRHVHTVEYINTSGIHDLYNIEYQYSPNGAYTVWFRKDDRITLTKTYDAKGKAVVQIEKPNTVSSITKKYYHNADGLLDHIDIFNSEDRLIDKEVYEYVYW